jgi:hypothetical protein
MWTPGFQLNAGTSYDFSFWWAGDNNSGWTGDVFMNTSQISTGATQVGTSFVTSGTTTTKTYQQFFYTFTPSSSGTYYFAIRVNATSSPWYLSFDDFRFEPTPGCPMPMSLTATGITQNSVNIGWTGAATVDIDYGAPGHPAGTGTVISNITTNPYTISGLSASTSYDVYVRQVCGAGNYSAWNGPINFATSCAPISTFPWTESFGATFPTCWSFSEGAPGASYHWATTTADAAHGASGPQSGTHFMFLYCYLANTTYNPYYLTTPEFILGGTAKQVRYYYYLGASGYQSSPDPLTLQISTDQGATWTDLYAHNNTNSTFGTDGSLSWWTLNVVNLSAYVNKTVTFRFKANSNYGSGFCDQGIDEFVVEDLPSCPMPTSVTVTNITNNSANIGWSNAATVDIDYGAPGHPAGTGTVVSSVTTNPYTLTGLTAYTSYDIFVRQSCGSGQYSTWAGPVNFTTQVDPLTIPYTQTFDASTFPGGWSQTSTISPRWTVSNTNNAGGTPYEMMASWASGTGISRLIVGPINTSGMTGLNLEFKYSYNDYAPGATFKIQSSSDLTNWTDEAFSFNSGGGSIGPVTVNTTVGSNVGSITYVAWVIDGNHYQYNYWYVDDVSISIPLPNDVGTVSIDIPSGIGPGSFTPKATVKNYGTNPNTFTVNMTITGGYNSTKTVTNLAPGATEQVTFDNWNATLGSYTVNVCTQLAGDQNTANDCKTKQFGVFSGNWSIGSTFPDGTYLGSGVAANGFLYILGGNTNSGLKTECFKYEVATDTWTSIAPLPSGRVVFASAAAGNYIFAIGGSDGTGYVNTVYKYDITANTWTTAAPLPINIGWGKAVGYNNNKIYFAGGVDAPSGGNYLATVYVYDVVANTWTAATSMPGAKFGGAFSVTGNKLVYVGGASTTGITNTVYVGTIDNLNPTVISWTTMEKTYPGLNKQIYSEYNGKLDEILMPDLKRITRGHLSPEAANYPPGVMYRFDGAPWGTDEIIVAGGSPSSDWVPADPNPTYRYNPTTDTWTQEADVPLPVLGAPLGTVNSGNIWKLIVASGLDPIDVTDATQTYTVDMGGSPSTFPLSVNITNGWNMVSVPGTNPDGMSVDTWWQYRDPLATVYKWANGANTPVTITAPTEGYWMFHSGTRTYNTGDEWPASGIQIVNHDPIPVTTGWNMFGVYEQSVPTANLSTTPANLIVSGTVYSWTGSYSNPTNLEPGYGYWVFVSGSGVINPPSALRGSGGGDAVLGKEISKDWGRIIISDSQGKSYTLYSVKGEVDLTHYLLPPLPPAGSFDIRYSSGHKAEDLSTDQTIDMQGLVYPITVKAEGQDIRVQDISGKLVNTGLKSGEELVIDNSSINKLMVSGTVIPDVYALEQNYPNPFNPSTVIEFSLPEDVNDVRLTIYDVIGQKVAELVNGKLDAGKYKYTWNASNAATGMYIYELRTEKFVSVKKMLLMK